MLNLSFQFQYTPQHLVRLLQIIVDGNCDLAVRQVASIHFKNFIAEHWSPHDPGTSRLNYLNYMDPTQGQTIASKFSLKLANY